jgi:hypothetical protein
VQESVIFATYIPSDMGSSSKKHPEMYNGVVLGAFMILISLIWFTIPFLLTGRTLLYPTIVFVLGCITIVRHSRNS